MSKGSKPRPYSVTQEVFASEWDRIFMGNGVTGSATVSNTVGPDSASGSPAKPIYIDNCTGRQVSEDHWPGDPIPEQQ